MKASGKKILLEPYDVLQIDRGAGWLDFSTLRTEPDFDHARRIVAYGWPDAPGASFRVWRPSTRLAVLRGPR